MKNNNFITCEQHWKNYSDNIEREKIITVMSVDGKAQCRLVFYPTENVQVVSDLYVSEDVRKQGYATSILNYIDTNLQERKYTMVFINEDTPKWLFEIYNKRGYIIRTI